MAFSGIRMRLMLGLLPLALTPGVFFLVAEGYVNLGGGCKDIIIVFPWLLWSISYFIFFMIAVWRSQALLRSAAYGAVGATALMALVFAGLYLHAAGWLGARSP